MKRIAIFIPFMCVAGFAQLIVIAAEQGTGSATQPTGGKDDLAPWVKDLASQNNDVRESAQKVLSALPYARIDQIRSIANSTPEGDVKTRLLAAVDAMETSHAINRPNITLDMMDASLVAINKAMAKEALPASLTQDRFTIHVVDMPFWEVVREMSKQHPVWIETGSVGGPRLARLKERWLATQYTGGVCIGVSSLIKQIVRFNPMDAMGRPDRGALTFSLGIAVDPRIRLLASISPPVFTRLRDSRGNEIMLSSKIANPLPMIMLDHSWTISLGSEFPLENVEGLKEITLSGYVTVEVGADEKTVVFEDGWDKVEQQIPVESGHVTLRKTSKLPNLSAEYVESSAAKHSPLWMSLVFQRPPPEGMSVDDVEKLESPGFNAIRMETQHCFLQPGKQGMSGSWERKNWPQLTVTITSSAKTKEVRIPFEFKQLPVVMK
jgi:hypothetical protein